jgi:hypothetical protein
MIEMSRPGYLHRLHRVRVKSKTTGKISNLPAIIKKDKSDFPASGMARKLLVGPTAPSPGPMFPGEHATAEAQVTRSRSDDIRPSTTVPDMNRKI